MGDKTKVAIVVDSSYEYIKQLIDKMPVWAVDSPANRATATILWPILPSGNADVGLTLFKVMDENCRELNCLNTIQDVELHHPEAVLLQLVGVIESEILRDGLANLNYRLEKNDSELWAVRV